MGVEGVDVGEQRGHDGWHAWAQVLRGEAVEVPERRRRISFQMNARRPFNLMIYKIEKLNLL